MLQVTNKGAGAAMGLPAQAGKPPLTVNSSAKVAKLNADATRTASIHAWWIVKGDSLIVYAQGVAHRPGLASGRGGA